MRRDEATGFNLDEVEVLIRATKVVLADVNVRAFMTASEYRMLTDIQERLTHDLIRLVNEKARASK